MDRVIRVTIEFANGDLYSLPIESFKNHPRTISPCCQTCLNNPENGGTGLCFCTMGKMHVILLNEERDRTKGNGASPK